jgi:hypothetical protein
LEALRTGKLQPTNRRIGKRRYHPRLPEFKDAESDIPAVKNIEGSVEPLR